VEHGEAHQGVGECPGGGGISCRPPCQRIKVRHGLIRRECAEVWDLLVDDGELNRAPESEGSCLGGRGEWGRLERVLRGALYRAERWGHGGGQRCNFLEVPLRDA
jgi:hypothetical protein